MIDIRSSLLLCLLLTGIASAYAVESDPGKVLRVCSDPNNLPYSNRAQQGFENKIAELIAADLHLSLEYTWFPQRMGFIQNTLKSWDDDQQRYRCDLVIGVPEGFDMSDTTQAYYRSSYALVVKTTGPLANIHSPEQLATLPMEQKKQLRLGAFVPSPSVDWLSRIGLFDNTTFFPVMSGDADYYPGKIIEDQLIPGNVDAVVIWGPIAGYFAQQHSAADLRVLPLQSQPGLRFDFAMAMGVRYGDKNWKDRIQKSINDNHTAIVGVLNQYQVPLVSAAAAVSSVHSSHP
jgi:quinoprotein dehydrogenase-associated probable ABC transporter substrate-binding protein